MSKATREIEWRLNYWIHLWALKLIVIWSAQKFMIYLFLHQNCSKKQNHLKNTIYNVNKVFEIWKKSVSNCLKQFITLPRFCPVFDMDLPCFCPVFIIGFPVLTFSRSKPWPEVVSVLISSQFFNQYLLFFYQYL